MLNTITPMTSTGSSDETEYLKNPYTPTAGRNFLDIHGNEFTVLTIIEQQILFEFYDGNVFTISNEYWDYLCVRPC